MSILLAAIWAFVLVASAGAVSAQEKYPARAVRMVVPFAPGGGVDVTTLFVGRPDSDA